MPRFLIVSFLVITLFPSCLPLSAEGVQTVRLTRTEAVRRALAENKALVAARSVIDQAEARRSVAGKLDQPEITVGYATDRAFDDAGESDLGIGITQSFPVTRRLARLKDLAEGEVVLAGLEVRNRERLLAQDVKLLCNEVAYLDSQLKLRDSMTELNRRFAEFVESRIQAAEASPIDANRLRIELFVLQQERDELGIEKAQAIAQLRPMLGMGAGAILEIAHRFESMPKAPNLAAYSSEMLNTHPEYLLRRKLLELEEQRTGLVRASRWKDITLGLRYENERSTDGLLGASRDRLLGMSVSIPLPIRDRSGGQVRESLSAVAQRKAELAAAAFSIQNEVTALGEEARRRFEQAAFYREEITTLVERNLEEMSDAYGAGQLNLSELFRSQSQALKIRSTQLEMRRDYEQVLVRWKAAAALNLEIID